MPPLHAIEIGTPELDDAMKRCNDAYDRGCVIHQAIQNCSDEDQKKVLIQKHREAWDEHKQASEDYRTAMIALGDLSIPAPE